MFNFLNKVKEEKHTDFLTACRAAKLDLPCAKMCRGCAAKKEKMQIEIKRAKQNHAEILKQNLEK